MSKRIFNAGWIKPDSEHVEVRVIDFENVNDATITIAPVVDWHEVEVSFDLEPDPDTRIEFRFDKDYVCGEVDAPYNLETGTGVKKSAGSNGKWAEATFRWDEIDGDTATGALRASGFVILSN